MLFVYRGEDLVPFWTFEKPKSHSISSADHAHRIVEISEHAAPCASKSAQECPHYGGHKKAQFVLEVNSGMVAKNGVRVGDTLDF